MGEELQVRVQYQLVAALQQREHDLAEAQRLANLGSWAVDVATGEVTWSDHLYRLLGMDKDEVVAGHEAYMSFVHRDDRAAMQQAVDAAIAEHSPFELDCRVELRTGALRRHRTRGSADLDHDGNLVRFYGTVQDVTDMMPGLYLDHADRTGPSGPDAGNSGRDALTGVADHGALVEQAKHAMARASRHRWITAVLIVDIDGVHELNEAIGYEQADVVLASLAHRLQTSFRASDMVGRSPGDAEAAGSTIGRFGGDRFAVVCEDVSSVDAAVDLVERVNRLVEEPFTVSDERQVEITVGIGVGITGPDGPDAEQRILDAESALHVAKLRGPAEWEMVADDRRERRSRRPELEVPLRRALDQGEFVLHYQPKLSLETGRITGVEALIRWQDPTRGLVPPAEFIPLAEDTGLIIPIGAWVVGEACAQAARWHELFPRHPPLTVSMNVSVRQFGPHLVHTMAAAIAANGIHPSALLVEVTESLLMSDVDDAVRVLNDLAALGVKLSIDDFGTGYSSLAQLKRFPFDELKIDKSFVDGIGHDDDDTAIVAATVAIAHALELSVVAEGVEDEYQLERLRVLGCQEVQGYFIARPGPPAALEPLLGSPPGRRAGAPPPVSSPSDDAGRSERILVVDDTDDVRQLARMTLTTVGFEVFEADSGATALILADRVQPECVILDISMPDMSGIEVCRSLRDNPRTAGCTIIMLTANAGAGDKIDAFAGGADDYIIKPFSPRDLVTRVRAAIQRESNHGSAPA